MVGSIYTLNDNTGTPFYVGSTIHKIKPRLYGHISYLKKSNAPVYKFIRSNKITPSIELLEEINIDNKAELLTLEKYWVHQMLQWGFNILNHTYNKSLVDSGTDLVEKKTGGKRGTEPKDISGQTFGYLQVIERAEKSKNGRTQWLCKCVCGKDKIASTKNLTIGSVKSCGCKSYEMMSEKNKTHGMRHSSEYNSWSSLKSRCLIPSASGYPDYGGRGISVCERWVNSFENFFADMGKKPSTLHSIDRINANGNYEPSNCRWAVRKQQNQNTRRNVWIEWRGENKTISEWRDYLKLSASSSITYHYKRGKSYQEIFDMFYNARIVPLLINKISTMILIKKSSKKNANPFRVVTTGINGEPLKTSENLSSKKNCFKNILADVTANYEACEGVWLMDTTIRIPVSTYHSIEVLRKKAGVKK